MEKKINKRNIIKTAEYAAIAVFVLFFYRCPFKLITGIDCPGCGMTRAFKATVRLDFASAFEYHPLFWLIGLEAALYLFVTYILKKKINQKALIVIAVLTAVCMLAVWVYRVFIAA